MKKLLFPFTIILLLFINSGCKEKIVDPNKDENKEELLGENNCETVDEKIQALFNKMAGTYNDLVPTIMIENDGIPPGTAGSYEGFSNLDTFSATVDAAQHSLSFSNGVVYNFPCAIEDYYGDVKETIVSNEITQYTIVVVDDEGIIYSLGIQFKNSKYHFFSFQISESVGNGLVSGIQLVGSNL